MYMKRYGVTMQIASHALTRFAIICRCLWKCNMQTLANLQYH